jgi:hypothetical protein
MRIRLAILASALVLAYPSTLLADTYEYQFSAPINNDTQFTFFTNALITSETIVTPTSCSYNLGGGTIDCNAIDADAFNQGDFFLEPTETYNNAEELITGFSFTELGTQSNPVNSLTITDIPTPTPEPSSILLLATGALLMTGIARRRFARQQPA